MDTISQSEGEDIIAYILEHIGEDNEYIEELAEKFDLTPNKVTKWLEKVKIKTSDVDL